MQAAFADDFRPRKLRADVADDLVWDADVGRDEVEDVLVALTGAVELAGGMRNPSSKVARLEPSQCAADVGDVGGAGDERDEVAAVEDRRHDRQVRAGARRRARDRL